MKTLWHVWQRDALLALVRLLVGAYPVWHRQALAESANAQSIWFSNHTSHIDTLAILAALPRDVRARVRPVAARDYWDSGKLKRHIARNILNAVLIDRHRESGGDPLDPVREALAQGHSVLIFPEGTRGTEPLPQPFKSGLFHLSNDFPAAALAPVYLENLQRIMPKGTIWPVPLICKVHFGETQPRLEHEDKPAFLARMHAAIVALVPHRPESS
ncbi:lysophospholipid acyltransferase family protein [Paraburkholderia acidisoli]|uniref:1-acyl-sn-glycerol-3-phosphate acyltransferase n=1 Tax=Paraburkholderia acidisoli TaxID=2571748 RepID=A0A7Z2JHP6_9BURK|nr:lysophospholipid acyltransferase family protein [Paraburkholderia acidisoli]QGZ64956.1 1-acyl-sn-glycerol-3-phosphate acyltransferase [Paraburkholderia acidisoli]